jgi:hypothetical protein
MIRKVVIGIFLGVFTTSFPAFAGDFSNQAPPTSPHFLHRLGPAGGWNPDGGGLFHWWDPNCSTPPFGPDDYCRKPFPRLCRTPRTSASGHRNSKHP